MGFYTSLSQLVESIEKRRTEMTSNLFSYGYTASYSIRHTKHFS